MASIGSPVRSRFAVWTLLCLGAASAAGLAVGCREQVEEDELDTSNHRVTEPASRESALLASTLLFENGCAGVKVGPRHVLTAARCVTAEHQLARGDSLSFALASRGRPGTKRAPVRAADAGADELAAEPEAEEAPGFEQAEIAQVHVNPSWASRCREDSCGLGTLVSSDAADVAVVELLAELDVPALPVDLDPVGEADPVFVTMSECAQLDTPAGETVLNRTIAVPPRSVVHAGSPYERNATLVDRLASSYVVTAGPGWDREAPGFCRDDVGGPVFRTGASVVVGVTSGFTAWTRDAITPATLHHTRVDEASREKVGEWLKSLGVQTIHSCSESTEGCVERKYEGGPPTRADVALGEDGDGGLLDGGIVEDRGPTRPQEERLEIEQPEERTGPGSYDFDEEDSGVRKKKKVVKSACTAAPAGAGDTSSPAAILGAALAIGAVVARRRRD